ncbi:hypothetical protein T190115A13A_190021 [Tenacibaculum sp. 190524A02b]|uniref:Uncharacterized protein n=1 Tax=Tenacibaculum vairaonense TaxID=3137860 RepID=A0ABM9PJG5_9FLAO
MCFLIQTLFVYLQSQIIGLWCNGNTPVFGTDIQGSSPCRPTKKVLVFIAKTFLL